MFRKKEVYTTITPIPGFIPRQLAIDILHSHSEVITLNPLVLDHKPIKAPRDAASDEFYSTWYEITERIQYVPGLGKMGSGKINFNGCFHDMPWGLQTHIYAPMNVDLRNKYRIAGNQPGIEPPEAPEIGLAELGIPKDGLYLREDIEIKCNVAVVGFVKAELKKASKEMVQRIIKKAELLDAGVLQGMIEDGKLKTINPADRSNTVRSNHNPVHANTSPQPSPTSTHYKIPGSPAVPYMVPRPSSIQYGARPGSQGGHQHQYHGQSGSPVPQELAAPEPSVLQSQPNQAVIMELPGDYYHPQTSPGLKPPPGATSGSPRASIASTSTPPPGAYPGDGRVSGVSAAAGRWSSTSVDQASRPSSTHSDGSGGGMRSPGLDHKGFSSDLATHSETAEEHHRDEALRRLEAQQQMMHQQQQHQQQQHHHQQQMMQQQQHHQQQQQQHQQQQQGGAYNYNPADYAKASPQMEQLRRMGGGYGYQYQGH